MSTTYGDISDATERAVNELAKVMECCGIHPDAAEDMARDHVETIKAQTLNAMASAWPAAA